jgi:addiction module HigA family antidote
MGVPATRVNAILNDNRTITADTALRLSRVFSTSTEFWLNLQSNYEIAMLDYTGKKDRICKETRDLASA